jgi:hypothetical protein
VGSGCHRADLPSGPLIATHARASGQHQLGVEPGHYQGLRQPPVVPSTRHGHPRSLALTAWPGAFPEVAVRALSVYDALCGQEGAHE